MSKFPQPTEGQLSESIDRYIGLNPYWWTVLEGLVDDMANPALWESFTAEIDKGIHELMVPVSPAMAFVGAKVYRSAAQSMGHNAITKISFDASDYLEGFQLTSGELVAAEAGYYSLSGCISWIAANNGVFRQVYVYINSAVKAQSAVSTSSNGQSFITAQNIVWEGLLNFGDSVTLYGMQASGAALSVQTGVVGTWLAIHKIGELTS